MALYETLFIIHPDHGGTLRELIERFKKIIEGMGGAVSRADEWGLRDLAYRIQKQAKGYYVLLQYQSAFNAVEELERNMKLSDSVLRYLTVRVEEGVSSSKAKAPPEKGPRSSAEAKPEPQS